MGTRGRKLFLRPSPRKWRTKNCNYGTIVRYNDLQIPVNEFPILIVSPSHSGPCCFLAMKVFQQEFHEGMAIYQYKRCELCGYTVRHVLRIVPDAWMIADLKKAISRTLRREHGW